MGAFGDYPRARVSSYLAELCQQHGLGHFGTFLTPAATQKAVANDFHRPRPVGTNILGVCRRRRETPSVGIFVSRKVTVLTLRGVLGIRYHQKHHNERGIHQVQRFKEGGFRDDFGDLRARQHESGDGVKTSKPNAISFSLVSELTLSHCLVIARWIFVMLRKSYASSSLMKRASSPPSSPVGRAVSIV